MKEILKQSENPNKNDYNYKGKLERVFLLAAFRSLVNFSGKEETKTSERDRED